MDMADSVRAAASTDMNEHSSSLHVVIGPCGHLHKSSGMRTFSKLHLVDLAVPRINKSNATGQALKRRRTSTIFIAWGMS